MAGRARAGNAAAVCFDDPLGNRQPEPGAHRIGGSRLVRTEEALEDAGQVVCADARPVSGTPGEGIAAIRPPSTPHPPAAPVEPNGVGPEVGGEAGQPVAVAYPQ